MAISRRRFVAYAGLLSALAPLQMLHARPAQANVRRNGSLRPDPLGLLELPEGFQYRILSRSGQLMSDGSRAPGLPDGMAAFAGENNTIILVRNHELAPVALFPVTASSNLLYDSRTSGGTSTLIVDSRRRLVRQFASLAGTLTNCAGGPTPWGSWLSCEENISTPDNNPLVSKRHGYVFEVPSSATSPVAPVPLVAMGRFSHEAAAVDPQSGIVYLTEDQGDSLFYRFIPNQPGNLAAGGQLQALRIIDQPQAITRTGFTVGVSLAVDWVTISEVDPAGDTVRVEGFSKGAAQFARGEGMTFDPVSGAVFFCCTSGGNNGEGQIWRYQPSASTLELFCQPDDALQLQSPDNVTISPFGGLFVCEDGDGSDNLIYITPVGLPVLFARNVFNDSEFAGATFSPDGQTLFVNIQVPGYTLAIWGPWQQWTNDQID
ncbi:MAG: DUF839 domain-containing protein [Anaerolineae bacterium]|nr:DUF839 domain-containing protein [Gloeobacterales cyanobacterium ES-bin-313]